MPAAAHSLSKQPQSAPPTSSAACVSGAASPLRKLAFSIAAAITEELADVEKLILQAQEKASEAFKKTRLPSREQAAEHLNLSLSQLDRLTKMGKIPATYIDSRPRYSMGALREFITARTHRLDPARTSLNSPEQKSMSESKPYCTGSPLEESAS